MIRAVLLLTVIGAAVSAVKLHHEAAPFPPTVATITPRSSAPANTPRPTPTRASRTRPLPGLTASGSGSPLSSTAYCETGLMANGHRTHRGAVAGNRWPLGTTLRVSDSPYGPGVFTVEDRIGHGSDLDYAIPGDCTSARTWGRRKGYLPPLWWDDDTIDDPSYTPRTTEQPGRKHDIDDVAVEHAIAGRIPAERLTRAERIRASAHLTDQGLTLREVADRLGLLPRQVSRDLADHRVALLEAAS